MLEPPDITIETISAGLYGAFGIRAAEIRFLPLGADVDTAVFRVYGAGGEVYFLKLRRGPFPAAAVQVPHLLARNNCSHVIAPLPARDGRLWAQIETFTAVLSPFIGGQDGWGRPLTPAQWTALGQTLRGLHALNPNVLPAGSLPREDYSSRWREQVIQFLEQRETYRDLDLPAQKLMHLLGRQAGLIEHLVMRAGELAGDMALRSPAVCICHGDIHAGNVLIDTDGKLYVVDWDTLILAPKERDLMFIGGGIGELWNRAEEETWFYAAYGAVVIDPVALAYYRCERIVEDIAAYCRGLLDPQHAAEGADRMVMYTQLAGQFDGAEVIRIALESEAAVRAGE